MILGAGAGHAALAAEPWLLPVGLLTISLGVLGALAAHSLARLVSYLTVASVGIIVTAIGLFTPAALSAALYYMMHSTLVGLARAGAILFWNVLPANGQHVHAGRSSRLTLATLGLLSLSLLLAVAASPLKRYTDAAVVQLADRAAYAKAVLVPVGGAAAQTTRPYRGGEGGVILPVRGDKP